MPLPASASTPTLSNVKATKGASPSSTEPHTAGGGAKINKRKSEENQLWEQPKSFTSRRLWPEVPGGVTLYNGAQLSVDKVRELDNTELVLPAWLKLPIPMEPNPQPHACSYCYDVVLDFCQRYQLDNPKSPYTYVYRLPYTLEQGSRAARNGCSLFKFLMTEMARKMLPYRLGQFQEDDEHEKAIYLRNRRNYYLRVVQMLSKWPFFVDVGLTCLDAVAFTIKFPSMCPCSFTSFYNLRIDPFTPTDHHLKSQLRPLNRNVSSDSAFQVAKYWLDDCIFGSSRDHPDCTPPKLFFTPIRLLEITGNVNKPHVRLHQTRPSERISYCWGGPQPFQTLKENIEQYREGIPFHHLAKSIQDAIIVVLRLKLRYLWVDSLCIIQDGTHKAKEITKMRDIYANALLTICASNAENPGSSWA